MNLKIIPDNEDTKKTSLQRIYRLDNGWLLLFNLTSTEFRSLISKDKGNSWEDEDRLFFDFDVDTRNLNWIMNKETN